RHHAYAMGNLIFDIAVGVAILLLAVVVLRLQRSLSAHKTLFEALVLKLSARRRGGDGGDSGPPPRRRHLQAVRDGMAAFVAAVSPSNRPGAFLLGLAAVLALVALLTLPTAPNRRSPIAEPSVTTS